MHVPDEPARQLLATLTARFKSSGRVLSFPEWEAERDRSRPLSGDEMRQAIDVAIAVLDDLYVHIDLKRTRRGIDPVRQLRVFRERVVLDAGISSRMFHRTMLEIFKSLGDVHTAYRLPDPYTRAIAFLPFLMCAYGPPDRETYIVSHSLMSATDEARALALEPGAEILTWNGVRIDEAVRRSTEFEEGSNLPHDLALGLQAMTIRWLAASYEPDSPWVLVGYTGTDGTYRETKCYWSVLLFRKDPKLAITSRAAAAVLGLFEPRSERQRALHLGSSVVHDSRLALFRPDKKPKAVELRQLRRAAVELRRRFYGYIGRQELREFSLEHDALRPDAGEFPSLLPLLCEAREHAAETLVAHAGPVDESVRAAVDGKTFGYLRIRGFPLEEPDRGLFKYELIRLLNLMPRWGLILDVRENPGGSANLAEESLQFLTPRAIAPLAFRFIASDTTRRLVQLPGGAYREYAPSVLTALETGGRFSAGRPLTSTERANQLGQHYFGPVVLLTNALTYSAADMFAAGFEDNGLGEILSLDDTTGAGGANCWFYRQYLGPILGGPVLPREMNMQFAVRQCARVGLDTVGVPLEEIGVRAREGHRYVLTRLDVLAKRPWNLLLEAASRLSRQPSCDLETRVSSGGPAGRMLTVRTSGIERLDCYVNGRPNANDVGDGEWPIPLPNGRVDLELRGFARRDGRPTLVARYIQVFPE